MNNGKATILERKGILEISVPSKKNWFILILGVAWQGGWYFGFINALDAFSFDQPGFEGIDGFMLVWLLGWSIAGIGVVIMLFWGFFGKERIIHNQRHLDFERTVFGLGLKKKLETKHLKNFRHEKVDEGLFGGNRWSIWGLGPGKIKFDYGMKTYSFGLGVDDAEANYLVDLLKKRFENHEERDETGIT
ncbi:MAG: hypothetical protein KDC24_02845 [Saprospiraceae bacterium]|nr:hypothetical protein [Saprospiraceae bacterium]